MVDVLHYEKHYEYRVAPTVGSADGDVRPAKSRTIRIITGAIALVFTVLPLVAVLVLHRMDNHRSAAVETHNAVAVATAR